MSMLPRRKTVSCPMCGAALTVRDGVNDSQWVTREGEENVIIEVTVSVAPHFCPRLVRRRMKDKS